MPLGRLGKTYQLKGGLRFYPDADDEAIFDLERVFIEGLGEADIREVRWVGQEIMLYLTRALNIEAAKPLVNRLVYAQKDSLPETLENKLIGFPVFLEGQVWGHVVDIQSGLQDLLVIEGQSREILIPLEASYVRIAENVIYLENLPQGLLDLNM